MPPPLPNKNPGSALNNFEFILIIRQFSLSLAWRILIVAQNVCNSKTQHIRDEAAVVSGHGTVNFSFLIAETKE